MKLMLTITACRPEFHNQIYSILYGAKSEIVMPLFVQKNVDLKTFLALTDEQLKNIGVALPFQRYRILAALHRFHKWPYKPSSIPVVPRSAVYRYVLLFVRNLEFVENNYFSPKTPEIE